MKEFFRPTKLKLRVFAYVTVYVLASILILATFNTTRSAKEFSATHEVLGLVATPAIILAAPVIIIPQHLFTADVSLTDFLDETGCTNCDTEEVHHIIERSTALGIIISLLIQIVFLYVFACCISILFKKRTQTGIFLIDVTLVSENWNLLYFHSVYRNKCFLCIQPPWSGCL